MRYKENVEAKGRMLWLQYEVFLPAVQGVLGDQLPREVEGVIGPKHRLVHGFSFSLFLK